VALACAAAAGCGRERGGERAEPRFVRGPAASAEAGPDLAGDEPGVEAGGGRAIDASGDAPTEAEAVEAAQAPARDAGGTGPGGPAVLAPAELEDVIPRVGAPLGQLCANLRYEANNPSLRGRRLPEGLYEDSGEVIAERWREAASSVRGLFVLRDALFSQQDHPLDHRAVALAMPPSWVTAAVAEVLSGRTPAPVVAPRPGDDAAWAAVDAGRMFGSFPPSASLSGWARRPLAGAAPVTRARVENARAGVAALARSAQAMIDAAPGGAEAVARAGAEQIAASDRRYFGDALRRDHVVPISVENPNRHEIEDEGKGFMPMPTPLPAPGAVSPAALERAVRLATDAVLRRRLADGDLALERYDLTAPADRRRAIDLLERLIPRRASGAGRTVVWLWVNGRLDERGVGGEDATAHIAGFRAEVAAADVDVARLRYLSKPHVALPGPGRARALREAVARFRGLGLPLSVNLGTGPLLGLWGEGGATPPDGGRR
jgi:hypothetical protein